MSFTGIWGFRCCDSTNNKLLKFKTISQAEKIQKLLGKEGGDKKNLVGLFSSLVSGEF